MPRLKVVGGFMLVVALLVALLPGTAMAQDWTYEIEKVPQVRWAGEKIVLEKWFGYVDDQGRPNPSYQGYLVRFALENESVGALEAAGPDAIDESFSWFRSLNLTNTNDTVWTVVDGDGFTQAILASEAPGEARVTLTIYDADALRTKGEWWILDQHGFVVFFLKLEEIMLSNVVGNRAGANTGPWVPENPWDSSTDVTSETLDLSRDTLLRARVKGWFMGESLSERPARYIDIDLTYDTSGDGDPTNDLDVLLPGGRWVLPDDWSLLAGTDWMELRPHWDIMDEPSDSIMSEKVPDGSELGPYLTDNGHGSLVAEAPVIGPFNPGWELPTPTRYDPLVQPWSGFKTVVPNGALDWWDAPMPPAKVTFWINSGPGYFKEADKGDIYYYTGQGDLHYTNPFYRIMVPAHPKIPALVNNGGYDWDSSDDRYGPYDFWTISNRSPNPQVPSDDPANYPTKVELYSDNHGEAMVFVKGNSNKSLDNVTRVIAKADYPYFRKHSMLLSNEVTFEQWTAPLPLDRKG